MHRRFETVRSSKGYSESPKETDRSPIGLGLIKALVPIGQSLEACISSRIATVIQVGLDSSNEP